MTDIVERLYDTSKFETWEVLTGLIVEAAVEIERLRAQMESGNYLTENDKLSLAIERQALEIKERDDEIERLRPLLAATERDLERALAALDHHLKADMARRRDEP